MAPDGKIYGTQNGADSLCVINNPSVAGTACNFQTNAVSLQGKVCYQGLPQFLQRYYLYIQHSGQCQWNPVQFNPLTWPPADSVHWDFGDPGSGAENFSTLAIRNIPIHYRAITGSTCLSGTMINAQIQHPCGLTSFRVLK
jgi:hypothetical protein